eukprot:Ihof_evm7s47 gene=Ihof_evmTU7s47
MAPPSFRPNLNRAKKAKSIETDISPTGIAAETEADIDQSVKTTQSEPEIYNDHLGMEEGDDEGEEVKRNTKNEAYFFPSDEAVASTYGEDDEEFDSDQPRKRKMPVITSSSASSSVTPSNQRLPIVTAHQSAFRSTPAFTAAEIDSLIQDHLQSNESTTLNEDSENDMEYDSEGDGKGEMGSRELTEDRDSDKTIGGTIDKQQLQREADLSITSPQVNMVHPDLTNHISYSLQPIEPDDSDNTIHEPLSYTAVTPPKSSSVRPNRPSFAPSIRKAKKPLVELSRARPVETNQAIEENANVSDKMMVHVPMVESSPPSSPDDHSQSAESNSDDDIPLNKLSTLSNRPRRATRSTPSPITDAIDEEDDSLLEDEGDESEEDEWVAPPSERKKSSRVKPLKEPKLKVARQPKEKTQRLPKLKIKNDDDTPVKRIRKSRKQSNNSNEDDEGTSEVNETPKKRRQTKKNKLEESLHSESMEVALIEPALLDINKKPRRQAVKVVDEIDFENATMRDYIYNNPISKPTKREILRREYKDKKNELKSLLKEEDNDKDAHEIENLTKWVADYERRFPSRYKKKEEIKDALTANEDTLLAIAAPVEEVAENSLAPMLMLDENGEIIVDTTSLEVEAAAAPVMLEGEIRYETGAQTTYHSFTKRDKAERWSNEDTDKFFKTLSQFGIDFTMIQRQFPNKTRNQVKNKFKKEEKVNRRR